jgi:hypothetical protein
VAAAVVVVLLLLLRRMRRVSCASGAAPGALVGNRKQAGIGTAVSGKVALRRHAPKGISVAAARRTPKWIPVVADCRTALRSTEAVGSTRVRCGRERVAQVKTFSAAMQS